MELRIIIIFILALFNLDRTTLFISKYYQLIKGKKYINKCLKTSNFNKKLYINNHIPKISVIIPIYNCENTIKSTIASIQNQRLDEIEIILVNDYSTDNSKFIIENIQKEDSRIIIINNNKNMGTLYSRNIGAIYANGKYIFCLDNDDLFLRDDIMFKLFGIAEKYHYDIIGFKVNNGYSYNEKIFHMYDDPFISIKKDKITYQPNLKFLSITNNDCHIWGKCIKNKIYKKGIAKLGFERSRTYLCNAEDDVIVLMLFNVAKSFKFIPIYGLFHLISPKTATYTLPKNHILFSKLFFLDLLFDNTKNDYNEKKYVVENAIIIQNFIKHKNITFNKKNRKYLKKILKKVFTCSSISKKDKTYLKNIFVDEYRYK